MNKSQGAKLNNVPVQESSNSNFEASIDSNDTDFVIESSKESATSRKTNVNKILEKNYDADDPAHNEFLQALMSKDKVKNTSVRMEFKRWLLQQIRELVSTDLVGKFEDINKVDSYYIRLHSIYGMTFQKFLDAY